MKAIKVWKFFFFATLITINFTSFSQNNNEVFTLVEEEPSFIGGSVAMGQFLVKNIQYPAEALEKNVQGTVYVSFIVEPDGTISNPILKRDIGYGCGEEAIRVIKMMPKWKPGKQKGKAVKTQMMLPVSFKLS